MCKRLTDCKVSGYDQMCMDACQQYGYEASEQGRAQLLTLEQYSCKQIQSAVAGTDRDKRPSTRTASPRPSTRGSATPPSATQAPSSRVNDDGYDDNNGAYDDYNAGYDDYDDGYASESTASRYGRARTSNSSSRDSDCSWVCRRLSECGFMSSDTCGDVCARAAANGQPLSIGNESCAQIRKASGSTQWTCWAEASVGTAYGGGPWTYSRKSLPGTGRTRDDAYLKAMRDCNAVVGMDGTLATSSGAALDSGACEITRCDPPGTPVF